MSRSTQLHGLARRLRKALGTVQVEAKYDTPWGSTKATWTLVWEDGPTVETLRRLAEKQARNVVPKEVMKELRYHRNRTSRSVLTAYAQRMLLTRRVPRKWEMVSIFGETSFPGDISDPRTEAVVALALAHVETASDWDSDRAAEDAAAYLSRIGYNGVILALWLLEQGRYPTYQPEFDLSQVQFRLEARVRQLLLDTERDLIGTSEHRDEHRVRVLLGEILNPLVVEQVEAFRRTTAADALADGIGLSSLSLSIGKSQSALRRRWGSLEVEVARRRWLRDHHEAWAAACRAAGEALIHPRSGFKEEHPVLAEAARTLISATAAHSSHAAAATVSAARLLLAEPAGVWPERATRERTDLTALLAELDAAPLPGQADRHTRRPATPSPREHQHEFELALRSHTGHAPLHECMDTALALFGHDQFVNSMRIYQGIDMAEIDLDAVTLLGLALYRAGLIEFGRRDAKSRARMHTHDIPVTDTIALLHDNTRTLDILHTEPGHPDFPDGRLPPAWADTVAALGADHDSGVTEGPHAWDSLLQKVRAVLAVGSVTTAGTVKHLTPLTQRYRVAGWYERSTAVAKPAEPIA